MRAIFISYRRSDTEGEAGRLSDLLISRFSDQSVFMDVDSIAPGRDFRRAIDESIQACSVVLVLIGPGWLDAHDDHGGRRLDAPNDYVRLEISAALQRDIAVIPVLIRGARMPHDEQLPEEIADLAYRNSVELTHARWRSDLQVLIDALEPLLGRTAAPQESSRSITPTFTVVPPLPPRAQSPVAAPTQPPPNSGSFAPRPDPLPPSQRRSATVEPSRFYSSTTHHTPSVIHPYRPPTAPAPHPPAHTPAPASHSHTPHPATHPVTSHAPHSAGVATPAITHAEIERVSRHLAHFIGPIAEIVVKRAAKAALTTEELLSTVSQEIETPADRAKFLRECHH